MNNKNSNKYNILKKNEILILIITSALITTAGSVFAIRVNKHIENKKKRCKKLRIKSISCKLYSSELGHNLILILLTFLSTLILGIILYYYFEIVI